MGACCPSTKPEPALTVAAELWGRPTPEKTSSLAELVVGVGPLLGAALVPIADAVLSSPA